MSELPLLTLKRIVFAVLIASVLMALLPLVLDDAGRDAVFAEETGLFEQASLVLWLILTPICLLGLRPPLWQGLAAAGATLFCAAREADWHAAFTADSVLKISYYLDPNPIEHRLVAALIVGVLSIALFATLINIYRYARDGGGFGARWVQIFVLFFAVIVISKAFDRSPALLRNNLGIELPELMLAIMQSLEEGLEMLLPPLLLVMLMLFRRARPAIEAGRAEGEAGQGEGEKVGVGVGGDDEAE